MWYSYGPLYGLLSLVNHRCDQPVIFNIDKESEQAYQAGREYIISGVRTEFPRINGTYSLGDQGQPIRPVDDYVVDAGSEVFLS